MDRDAALTRGQKSAVKSSQFCAGCFQWIGKLCGSREARTGNQTQLSSEANSVPQGSKEATLNWLARKQGGAAQLQEASAFLAQQLNSQFTIKEVVAECTKLRIWSSFWGDVVLIHKYKTTKCKDSPGCRRGDCCHFAHGEADIRQVQPCGHAQHCDKGPRCEFAHTLDELRVRTVQELFGMRARNTSKKYGWCTYHFGKGCNKGDACEGAHSGQELPLNFKIAPCKTRGCLRKSCTFAHGNDELRKFRQWRRIRRPASAPQGVSVHFLVNDFDRILQLQFGAQYNESTTFVDLAVLLWGPANARFSKTVDLLDHVSLWDESRGACGVSLCKAIGERCAADVGIATLFISWTWRYSVKKFLEALRNYCFEKKLTYASTFVWVCFLCNNQFDWLSGPANDGVETFGETVTQIGKVVCLVDSFRASTALYFSRLWTVFEVFIACVRGVDIDFWLMYDSEEKLRDASIGDFKASIKEVDVMNASASDEHDEKKIKARIEEAEGGASAVNKKVADLFIEMVGRYFRSD
mmetsp:Transcript_51938/g.113888  ORF Transcript_51938/g.113888 Transcript_51938/m.113888 type:complete len:524 (-) Transcript_51938:119-1690(-)